MYSQQVGSEGVNIAIDIAGIRVLMDAGETSNNGEIHATLDAWRAQKTALFEF